MADEILENAGIAFEKYKQKIELFKWLIGSVALVLVTTIIDWGFKDRAAGLQEIQQYDKYATELIIMNDNPKSKRMLAQYFSNVIPSEKLKAGWKLYFAEVDAEYSKFLSDDSIAKRKVEQLKKDSANLSSQQKTELTKLQMKVDENQRTLNQPIVLPKQSSVVPTVYIQINREEQRADANQMVTKFIGLGFNSPGVELVESVVVANNQLRYFRESDLESAKTIQSALKDQNVDVSLKFIPSLSNKTKEGVIELWLK